MSKKESFIIWKEIKNIDDVPKTRNILLGREKKDADDAGDVAEACWDHEYQEFLRRNTDVNGGFSIFRSPTHWSEMPEPPINNGGLTNVRGRHKR